MNDQSSTGGNMTRQEFLKGVGIAVGAAGMAGVLGGTVHAADAKADRYIVVITNGGNSPNRAILGLLSALTALEKKFGSVHVWMTLEGAELANKAKASRIESPIFKKFGNAEELMKKLVDKGATFGVCPPCAEYMGAVGSDRFDFVEKQGADYLMKEIRGAVVAWM